MELDGGGIDPNGSIAVSIWIPISTKKTKKQNKTKINVVWYLYWLFFYSPEFVCAISFPYKYLFFITHAIIADNFIIQLRLKSIRQGET